MEGIRIPGLPGQRPQNQIPNLIKQTSADTILRPHGFTVSIILDVLTVGSAAVTGYFYWLFTTEPSWSLLGYAGIGFFFLSMCSVLQMFLWWRWERRALVMALEVVALVGWFHFLPFSYLASVAAAAFFFLMWGEVIGRGELRNGLEIKFFKTVGPQLNRIITGMILAGLLLYLPQWDAKKSFFSEDTYGTIFGWSSGLAQNFYPELVFNASVGDFAKSLAHLELAQQEAFRQLPPDVQATTLTQAEGVVITSLESTFHVKLNEKDTMQATTYRLLTDTFASLNDQFGSRFLFVWAVGVFFFVRSFGIFLQIILSCGAAALYQICLGTNIIHVAGQATTQEVVEYS